jgi:hypothetical protein
MQDNSTIIVSKIISDQQYNALQGDRAGYSGEG